MSITTVNKLKFEIIWKNHFNDQECSRNDLDELRGEAFLALLRYCPEVYAIRVRLIYVPE